VSDTTAVAADPATAAVDCDISDDATNNGSSYLMTYAITSSVTDAVPSVTFTTVSGQYAEQIGVTTFSVATTVHTTTVQAICCPK